MFTRRNFDRLVMATVFAYLVIETVITINDGFGWIYPLLQAAVFTLLGIFIYRAGRRSANPTNASD